MSFARTLGSLPYCLGCGKTFACNEPRNLDLETEEVYCDECVDIGDDEFVEETYMMYSVR